MNPSALIIFDVDGTLFQTYLVTVPAVQQTFARFGMPAPAAEVIQAFFGRPVVEYEAWLVAQCPAELTDAVLAQTNARELEFIAETGRLYPGAREALEELQAQGHVLTLCSNGPDAYVAEFVRAHGMDRFFAAVRSGGTRTGGKTAMAGELVAMFPARGTVLVGDRADDMAAARAHGAFAVAAAYGFGSEVEWQDADARVSCPAEIPSAVARLLAR
jgi:phosphoglycolate phosphatase